MIVKILKLSTGEELVAGVDVLGEVVTLTKPFLLTMAKDPNNPGGEMQLALFPYAPYVKDHTIKIDMKHLIWFAELPDTMIKDYNNALTSLKVTDVNFVEDEGPVHITRTF
jgi:hypothetical protein